MSENELNPRHDETPDVLQGRLGLEDGDVSEVKPDELEQHPKNADIYGDTDDIADVDDTFVESVREKGVLEHLVVTDGKKIISGHRRWLAAQAADVDSVPIRKCSFDSDLAEREALIEFNRQREKTPGQIVNEFEEMLAVEKERAEKRKEEAGGHVENLPQGESGKARDKAAEKVNADVSGRTLKKGHKVKTKATSDDEPEPVKETAQDAWNDLQSGDESFSGAFKRVKQTKEKTQTKKKRDRNRKLFRETVAESGAATVTHGDFVEVLSEYDDGSLDHIITDPPYDEDALSLWEDLATVAAKKLTEGGYLIAYSGQSYLPRVYDILASKSGLDYIWQFIVTHESAGKHPYHSIGINYKPVLFFGKQTASYRDPLISDIIDIGEEEKEEHEWQQSVIEAEKLIEKVTEPNDLVCDPMCGSGTTGVAALRKKRRTLLVDIDEGAVETAKKRIAEVLDTDGQ